MAGYELGVVEAMFHLYDHRGTGRILRSSALKILSTLGLPTKELKLPVDLSLEEVVSIVEFLPPKTETGLQSQLDAFHLMMNAHYSPSLSFVDPEALTSMLRAEGGSKWEIQCLLESMMDWDDCGRDPKISCERFNAEITRVFNVKHMKSGAGKRSRVRVNASQ